MPRLKQELVTLSDAKVRLHELVRGLPDRDVLLLRHGRPVAAMVSYARFEALVDKLEDLQDRIAVFEAAREAPGGMVPWD